MSLRLEKKQLTKQKIIIAAFTLLAQRGYDQVTLREITEEAGISPRTFFSYFKSKEDVLFSPLDELAESLYAAFSNSPDTKNAITIFQQWLMAAIDNQIHYTRDPQKVCTWRAVINNTPILRARELRYFNDLETFLVSQFAKTLQYPHEARLLAASAAGMFHAMYQFATEVGFSADYENEIYQMAHTTIDFLQQTNPTPQLEKSSYS